MRVANIMNMKDSIQKAIDVNSEKLYPYIFIDKTNQARVSGIKIYTDLFSRYKQIIYKSMLSYIISEADFRSHFKIIDSSTAIENGHTKNKKKSTTKKDIFNNTQPADSIKSTEPTDGSIQSREPTSAPTNSPAKVNTSTAMETSQFRKRKLFERQVKQALQRYKIRSKL